MPPSDPDPARGAYSAHPAPWLYLRGLLLRRGTGRGRGGKGKENGEEKGGKARERDLPDQY